MNTVKPILKIGFVSNALEWYEFSIYACLAGIMGQLFLADAQPTTRLIQAYTLFAVSYLARPIGSLFWGYWGDRKGRGTSLKLSLIMMAVPTLLIGLLPTYHQVGFFATGCLLLLRVIQGFAAGGELPISACYVYETAPLRHRGFLCSTVSASCMFGILMGSCISTFLFWYFDHQTLLAWAWRIPYLLSLPLTGWIYQLRKSIGESGALSAISPRPMAFQAHLSLFFSKLIALRRQLLPVLVISAFMEVCMYTVFIWMPAYLTHFLGVSARFAQACNVVGLVAWVIFTLIGGYVVSNYKNQILRSTLAIGLFIYPLFLGLKSASGFLLIGIHLVFAYLLSGIPSVIMQVLGDAFPTENRAFGMSVVIALAGTIFGGGTPLICTYLTAKTGIVIFPAFYMLAFGLIALPFVLRLNPVHASVSKLSIG